MPDDHLSMEELLKMAHEYHIKLNDLREIMEGRKHKFGEKLNEEHFMHSLEAMHKYKEILDKLNENRQHHLFLHNLDHALLHLAEINVHMLYAHIFEPRSEAKERALLQAELEAANEELRLEIRKELLSRKAEKQEILTLQKEKRAEETFNPEEHFLPHPHGFEPYPESDDTKED